MRKAIVTDHSVSVTRFAMHRYVAFCPISRWLPRDFHALYIQPAADFTATLFLKITEKGYINLIDFHSYIM